MRYFGTDGIRGRVGEGSITPEFMLKLGWAAGRVLSGLHENGSNKRNKVLIGKDTRISGYMFESALEAGLSAAGIDILLLGPMPTPAIAYLTRTLQASAGIVISASHNPYYDNGIKFFSADGSKLPDEVELAIEAELEKNMETVDSAYLGKAERVADAPGRYIEFCKSTIPPLMSFKGFKIVVDCAHGATYHIAPEVFDELGAEVIKIGAQPNGLNINQDCGSTKPKLLQKSVLEHGADFGIAFDGDGDRVVMVDAQGTVVDGDELLYIIACQRQRKGHLNGGVVGTLMTNLGLERALEDKGIPLIRAKVGDRHVLAQLVENNWVLGGESSGHIICLDRTTTGDGIVSVLQVLAAMSEQGKTLQQLRQGVMKYPMHMINVPMPNRIDIEQSEPIQTAVKDAEQELAKKGRVLLRPSGTEPVVRVMVEGMDGDQVKSVCERLAETVKLALA